MTSNVTSVRGSSESRGYVRLGTLAATQLLRVLPRTRISHAVGQLCERPLPPALSKAMVALYAGAWGVDMGEAERPNHSGAFVSFDDFFTRRLRPGCRHIPSGADVLVSPCDGVLEAAGAIGPDLQIQVKGKPYGVADLLCDERAAAAYRGGRYAVVYLSPRDYHRVHAPCAGRLVEVRSAPGDLFPVNALGERIPRLLSRNRRVALLLDSQCFGRVAVIMVAAMMVGRITVAGFGDGDVPEGDHLLAPPLEVAAGDELGVFHLGSTVVLLAAASEHAQWQRALGRIKLGDVLDGAGRGTTE